MAQVAARNTPVTAADVLGAILSNSSNLTGARIILAQSAFETGGWQGGVWNYNLGNIKYTGSGDFFTIQCSEIVGGVSQMQPCSFRAYSSLSAGAGDYVRFLAKRGLVAIANTGDLSAYVARLKAVGYATALTTPDGYAAYQNGMAAWMQRLANVEPPPGFNVALGEIWGFVKQPAVIVAAGAAIAAGIVLFGVPPLPALPARRRRRA